MGPTGVGKSTVGRIVSNRLAVPFVDADEFHTPANIALMRAGTGLTDEQRSAWLSELNDELRARRATGVVLACSALKPGYRQALARGIGPVTFVNLSVRGDTLLSRLRDRMDHFAGPELVPSQLETLDLGDDTVTVDGEQGPEAVADAVMRAVATD
jgi:carbohydrate kinase (thermoresistant glucokinase family)